MMSIAYQRWNGHDFKNNRPTSQFLSNYTGIQMLAGVRPEDIEDVTERYHAFLGIEFESDTIKGMPAPGRWDLRQGNLCDLLD